MLKNTILNFSKRCDLVIEAKGGHITYKNFLVLKTHRILLFSKNISFVKKRLLFNF